MSPEHEKLAQSISELPQLMSDVGDSLRREMREGFVNVTARLDRINTKVDHQNALMETAFRPLRKPKI
jgi:hypothetical protein